jgi:hypothetical protein
MQTVLKDIHDDSLRAYIIWMPCIQSDDRAAAVERVKEFSDSRVTYFWDQNRITGTAWQKTLGLDSFAWDVYLLYGRQVKWEKDLVQPNFWMHQLGGVDTAPRLDQSVFESKVKEYLNSAIR